MEDVELDVGSYSLNELFDFVGVTPADTQAVAHLAYGRKKTAIRGLVDHVMDRINALLDPPYQFAEDLVSDGVQGTNRFL